MRTRPTRTMMAAAAAVIIVVASFAVAATRADRAPESYRIGGPYAALLAHSTDLGPARGERVRLTAALRAANRPDALYRWAQDAGLSVTWRPGDTWALVEGPPAGVERALGVSIHDYRGDRGQVFYASPQQPAVPARVAREVQALGRILSYTPHRQSRPWPLPREVPDQGLTPQTLLRAYNAQPLHDGGHTGDGVTVVVFGFDGFDQADLDLFSSTFDLPAFVPEVVGGQPAERDGETAMDLQAIHAMAPGARKVFVNARPTVQGDAPYARIAAMLEDTSRRYPGAVWSFSIGWGCDKLITAADLEPVRAAVRAAHREGTTAFNASGDLAGLECKGGQKWAAPPSNDDIGLDAVASIPEMTSVGGTTLSTDATGGWLAEQAWFDPPLSQGTGGGTSALFARPQWQQQVATDRDRDTRLTPDIAAVADPFTGVKIVVGGQFIVGGGTSLSAPIWAGLTASVNSYLSANGARPVGEINPLLYRIARGAEVPAFRDITLGGNAVEKAGPGYDLVTGLGTPDADNLARAVLALRRAGL